MAMATKPAVRSPKHHKPVYDSYSCPHSDQNLETSNKSDFEDVIKSYCSCLRTIVDFSSQGFGKADGKAKNGMEKVASG